MSSCEEQIYSNDYVDFIISKDVLDVIDLPGECIQRIEDENETYFEEFFFPVDSYASIPKCYGLSDETALEVSGILKLQQQPALSLRGEGVMVGFIDTGIDYRNQVFRYSDGSTRIFRIWEEAGRDRVWFRIYEGADQRGTAAGGSTVGCSVHGYKRAWDFCGGGHVWE